jgi:O-antigen/teichoic acid export membrane protein
VDGAGSTRLVAKNTLLLTLGLLAGRALALLVLRKMTPLLGPDGIGIWGLATDLTTILLTMANFGLGVLVTREIARARGMTWPIFWAALRVRWLMGIAGYLILIGYVRISGLGSLAQAAVLVTGLAIFVETTSMTCDAVLQAHDRVEYQTGGQLVSAVVYFGLAYWFLVAGHGLMGVIWANLLSRLARLAVMVPLMFQQTGSWRGRPAPAAPRPEEGAGAARGSARWMMRLGLPLFLSTTFGILYYKVDVVMLMSFVGEAATGIYVLGHRALDVLMLGPNIFATALFPVMARYGPAATRDAARLGERSLRFMMLAVLPVTLLVAVAAAPVIGWFDRQGQFPASVAVLQLVIWGLPFQGANMIYNRLLITAGRERSFIVIALVAMLANVSLNLLLIPRYSYFGAAAATVTSLAVSSAMHTFFARRTALRFSSLRAWFGPVAALAAAWLATVVLARLLVPRWGTGWLALPAGAGWGPSLAIILATGILYLVASFVLGILTPADLRLLRQLGGATGREPGA